jgi:tripartite-type tricarboxylate transporter receptor subunit TctC
MKTTAFALLIMSWLALGIAPAAAQSYPAKPIRMIIGFPPGGGTDIAGRLIGASLQTALAQAVVIENRPGANGLIAMDMLAKSAPDGYTISMGAGGPLTINPLIMKNVPYDPIKDIASVGMVSANVLALLVHPSFPAKSVQELIAQLKAKPDGYNYASSSIGSPHHLTMELFKSLTGTRAVHVPYKGSADVVKDMIGGQVLLAFETLSVVLPHTNAGRLRLIAVTSAKRSQLAPDAPTVAESGLPGFESFSWYGVIAPAGVPAPIIGRLNGEIRKALTTADVRHKLTELGAEPLGGTAEEMNAFIRAEIAKWGRVIKEARISLD